MDYDEILQRLKSLSDPRAVEGMARFGINQKNTLGVSIPNLRKIAKEAGTDHLLAQRLWGSGLHEVRILASMVDDPEMVTERQMERWVKDFDSWDVCDQCCSNLFDKTKFAYQKAAVWSKRREEFVKRAGFALMATLAVHDRRAGDMEFLRFLPVMKLGATDERNLSRKSLIGH